MYIVIVCNVISECMYEKVFLMSLTWYSESAASIRPF